MEELTHCHSARIYRRSTLLIDDDAHNVRHALSNGVNAVLFCPMDPSSVERGILAMMNQQDF